MTTEAQFLDASQPSASATTMATQAQPTAGTVAFTSASTAVHHSPLNSTFPVLLPHDAALVLPQDEFDTLVQKLVTASRTPRFQELQDAMAAIGCHGTSPLKRSREEDTTEGPVKKAPFIEGLKAHAAYARTEQDLAQDNLTLTENADLTYMSSQNSLVDLFYNLGENTQPDHLKILLENAWKEDPLMTLKIIFNTRSIHLGKGNKISAYKSFGWLAERHPATLLTNLIWLVRPIIEKKVQKTNTGSGVTGQVKVAVDDFDMVDAEEANFDNLFETHDVRSGISHGYYKDLLNIVALAANDQLTFDADPSALLTQKQDDAKGWRSRREWDAAKAKEQRQLKNKQQHTRVLEKLQHDSFYRTLHLVVARIFAHQLKKDRKLLDCGNQSDLRNLSLAAKWAPSHGEFHDKHTFILSSIAEMLFPNAAEICPDTSSRELYLRHAREAFRKTYLSPLRNALAVVERDIAARTYSNIKYERVPSLAMDRYTKSFIRNDYAHFFDYVKRVATGKATISGATLLPSKLVAKARGVRDYEPKLTNPNFGITKAAAEDQVTRQVIDGQWNTLVQRVKDSGALSSSIAVCDVSGSMDSPKLNDKTVPMDSAIGLSLLVSEVTASPFGGGIITFSTEPKYISVGGQEDSRGLIEKVRQIEAANWSMNTNFVSVFEDVILPMALDNNLKQEDMVKQVFVFSDMQFYMAERGAERWTTSFQRIKRQYEVAGYEMPKLIFWNLAADSTSKPVTMGDENTALVSGYSQGMLKIFLDGGGFEVEESIVEKEEDGLVTLEAKKKPDQLSLVKKAVSHKAYSMLQVVD
ncbi:hypothetical protein N0V90_013396 [Kalmusia sp. IMI 367209]|nr:hypothetical protein N0V90_013396 [Kalmusia sp. IMI 367209]